MSAARLLQLRDAICDQIKTAIPDIDVEGHLGRFDEAELVRFMAKAPAIRVAVLGIEDPRPTSDDGVDYSARVGFYIVTKDGAVKMGRDASALMIVEQLLLLGDRNRWGLKFCRPAEKMTAQNLYTKALSEVGTALWAIDMRQPIRIAADLDDEGKLPQLFLGFAPEIGAAHRDAYLQVEGAPNV